MLAISLFCTVFLTVVWGIYSVNFVIEALSGISFSDAGLTNVLMYVLFICLPLLILWAVFGYISQYLFNRSVSKQLFKLFSQIKKNQDYSDLLARIMLETEQNIKSSFMLGRFDLLVADMNELLSEFLVRARLATEEQIENLWIKVQNGGKWAFGKVIIENYNRQPSFQKRILAAAMADSLLSGTLMEFCARYQTLLNVLEKYDKEKIFLGVIETGVMGKVFSVLAPVTNELRRSKEAFSAFDEKEDDLGTVPYKPQPKTKEKKSFFGKLKTPKEETVETQKDEFSLALERSFGNTTEESSDKEPVFTKNEPIFDGDKKEENTSIFAATTEKEVLDASEDVSDTQKVLDALKSEWSHIDTSNTDKQEEDLTYPFGGWTDADNYKK